ncbi:MAG TPA: chemotaxis protein CheW [Vicinamibacterales bacterium]|jgi:purine-binding chemotaxis protein CheW
MARDQVAGATGTADRGGQFATFVVDGLWFGVEVSRVQEVLNYQDMTRVPRASGAIVGLINLRGQIVTAIDMRRRLGLKVRPPNQVPMNVVILADDGAVSLLVDEIGDVIDLDGAAYEPVPESLSQDIRAVATGVYKLENHLLLTVGAPQVLDQRGVAAGRTGAREAGLGGVTVTEGHGAQA